MMNDPFRIMRNLSSNIRGNVYDIPNELKQRSSTDDRLARAKVAALMFELDRIERAYGSSATV